MARPEMAFGAWDNLLSNAHANPQTNAYYFTTAGFYTSGTMTFKDGRFASHEFVTGSAEGVTEVRGTGELRADGTLVSKSEYLKEGKWMPGHEVTYREDPNAEVVFK